MNSDQDRLNELAKRGWAVIFQHSWQGWDFFSASAGDCNCGHRKEYDPKDGHGYSHISEEDIPFDGIPDNTPLSWWLDRLEEAIDKVPAGEPWAERPAFPVKADARRWWKFWQPSTDRQGQAHE